MIMANSVGGHDVDLDEEEEEIDEEQVKDYCEMLDGLGNIPEKVAINSLSMAAEDFASSPNSASTIHDCICSRLIDRTSPGISSPNRKIPLVYVLDSLLKNVKGVYINIIQDNAATWMSTVYNMFDEANMECEKASLRKVWNTWKEFGVIDDNKWRQIGQCFIKADEKEKATADLKTTALGIGRNTDGTLQLEPSLRRQMQLLLDEVQSTGVDELEKVSLERLADINPDLLKQIKEASEITIKEQDKAKVMQQQSATPLPPSSNAAPAPTIPLSDWTKLKLNHMERTHDLISSLQRHVRSANETEVIKAELDGTTHLYAAISASAQLLTDMLQQWKNTKDLDSSEKNSDGGSRRKRRYSLVRPEKFNNDGLKERNDAVIAQLYEVGLPFVCSADGKRFASQIDLSKHLDALFRKSQIEKTMETTEEQAWYPEESVWIVGENPPDAATTAAENSSSDALHGAPASDGVTTTTTVIADETRDRCILCGINFSMFFDQEDTEWKYKNCREINVEHDGPTMDGEESEAVLVHVTCWQGLGSPESLTVDQIR